MLDLGETFEHLFFETLHSVSMSHAFEMQASVHEEKSEPRTKRELEALRFARGGLHIQEDLALILVQREGEYVGGVCFLTVRAVYLARQSVAAKHKRKLVVLAPPTAG